MNEQEIREAIAKLDTQAGTFSELIEDTDNEILQTIYELIQDLQNEITTYQEFMGYI